MAGIGIKLNRIFEKRSITSHLIGFSYSTMTTVAPMFVVIGAIVVMQFVLGYNTVNYYMRERFSVTILYIFIFSLLTASPFNAIFSRYLSDVIYNETYEDILPCFNIGLVINVVFSCLFGIPFCIHEYVVGQVWLPFVVAGYMGFVSLVLVFYAMLYLSICKDYGKISLFFTLGMLLAIGLAMILVKYFNYEVTFAMLVSLDVGFVLIASLEMAVVRNYFRESSGKYLPVLKYFKLYWKLVFTNFLYSLGLYIHNFVFWTTDMRMVFAKSFVSCQVYDMATFLAMFTAISSTIIFIARTEMHFHERYKTYSEAVIGGRHMDIIIAKQRMFRQLADELMTMLRIQFIISVVVYLLCIIFLPRFGYGGAIMRIYPCLAAGYFILYIMYSTIMYLYYFDDLTGSVITSFIFCVITFIGSIIATDLPDILYGAGVVAGSLAGWTFAFFRLRYIEKNLDEHVFCKGIILEKTDKKRPSSKVFDRYANEV